MRSATWDSVRQQPIKAVFSHSFPSTNYGITRPQSIQRASHPFQHFHFYCIESNNSLLTIQSTPMSKSSSFIPFDDLDDPNSNTPQQSTSKKSSSSSSPQLGSKSFLQTALANAKITTPFGSSDTMIQQKSKDSRSVIVDRLYGPKDSANRAKPLPTTDSISSSQQSNGVTNFNNEIPNISNGIPVSNDGMVGQLQRPTDPRLKRKMNSQTESHTTTTAQHQPTSNTDMTKANTAQYLPMSTGINQPISDGMMHDYATHPNAMDYQNISTKNSISNNTMPNNTMPNNTFPDNAMPNNTMSNNTMPTNRLSTNTIPYNTMPSNTMPNNTMSNNTMPSNTGPMAGAHWPQSLINFVQRAQDACKAMEQPNHPPLIHPQTKAILSVQQATQLMMQTITQIIQQADDNNTLWKEDWDSMAVPNIFAHSAVRITDNRQNNVKIGNKGDNSAKSLRNATADDSIGIQGKNGRFVVGPKQSQQSKSADSVTNRTQTESNIKSDSFDRKKSTQPSKESYYAASTVSHSSASNASKPSHSIASHSTASHSTTSHSFNLSLLHLQCKPQHLGNI